MNIGGVSIEVSDAVAIIELAAKLGMSIYGAIDSHGSYTDEQKAALRARVKAAGNYVPRDLDAVPAPKPTPNERPTPPGGDGT